MKNEKKVKIYNFFILFLFTILNFINVSYYLYVALKIVTFFLIPIVQTEAPKSYFVKGKKIYKTAPYFLKKHSFCEEKILQNFHFVSRPFSVMGKKIITFNQYAKSLLSSQIFRED